MSSLDSKSPVFFVFYLVAGWCFFSYFFGQLGWRRAVLRYPATSHPSGISFRGLTGWFNLLDRYNRCLNATLSDAGVYVVPQLIFRLGHPPILLPWSSLRSVTEGFRLGPVFYLDFIVDASTFRLILPGTAAEALRRYSGTASTSAR